MGRLIFIHVPKCGGSYVREVMRALGVPLAYTGFGLHTPWKRLSGLGLAGYSFGFIRHPADWLASFWAFRRSSASVRARTATMLPDHEDWATFVSQTIANNPGYVSALMDEYTDGLGYVGQIKTIKAGIVAALNHEGIAYDNAVLNGVPPINVTPGRPAITGPQITAIEQAEAALMNKHAPEMP